MPINPVAMPHSSEQERQDALLQQYLKGFQEQNAISDQGNNATNLEQQKAATAQNTQQANVKQALSLRDQLDAKGPGKSYNVGLTPGGGVDIKEAEKDPLAALLGMQRFKEAQDARMDKNVQGISDRIQKTQIPQMQSNMDALGLQEGKHLNSVGPVKNYVPDSLVGLIGAIPGVGPMAFPPGSVEERQKIAAIRNAAMHAQFGSRQTDAEKAMLADQLGLHGGTQSQDVEKAISRLGDVSALEGQNIMRGANPGAVKEFQNRGGNVDFGRTSAAPPAPDETVDVISPEGKAGKIPRKNLQAAQQRGFKVVGQ